MQLRTLVLGNKNVTRRVSNSLAGSGISFTCQSEVSQALNLLKKEQFDLALVDGYMDDIESVCYRITWLYRSPVVLIINGTQADWNILRSLDVDGFIPEEANHVELVTYFQTIARRKTRQFEHVKILVIEDDQHTQEALRLAFQIYWPESEVSFAACGLTGVKIARNEPADVILLDLMLPDISGFEVLSKIRSFSQTPVVVITATRNEDDVIKTICSGASDYMIKPFKQLELMSRIRRLVNTGAGVN